LQNTASFASARDVTLEAGGGTFETDADLTLSGVVGGEGMLAKTGDGTLTLTGENTYGGGTTISAGTLQLGDGGDSGSIAGDVLNNGVLAFNRFDTYTFDGLISGDGAMEQIGDGTTILTGANSYAGETLVQSGTLLIDGDQSGATGLTSVATGATLGGTGIIGGTVEVADGGAISPGNTGETPATLTINGNLALNDNSQLDYNFGQAGVVGGAYNDLIEVGGNLALDGVLNVTETAGGNFGPGLYRIISYEGELTDNGLTLGDMPDGDFFVQTSVANQVNLINATDLALNFWDGPDGVVNDGDIHGGSGVWSRADSEYWTTDTGAINAPYANAAFAIFTGNSGTVTVNNEDGPVEALGMQFATDGYVIAGDALTLVGDSAIIRVGDGTADGADMTATIDAVLSGDAPLVKDDLGTLVLNGINTYTGGTVIQDGTLQVSADEKLGDVAGGLTFEGGMLHTTASFESNRDVALTGTGTFLTDDATTLTVSGSLDGEGGLTKAGGGELVLAGASSYSGATSVAQGTLRAGAADVFSSFSAFSVLDDAQLDLDGFDQTVGSLANAGTVSFSGAPGATLTVLGDYEGDGGTIVLNTVLDDDGSATDRLVIDGDTSGDTDLRVANVEGGGAQTTEGIKIIDVGGASNGNFSLLGDYVFEGDQAVVAGAYAYRLYKGGVSTPDDGDWYLRSTLTDPGDPDPDPEDPEEPLYQPGVPVYEAYAGALQTFVQPGTLQQRLGNRSWGRGAGQNPVAGDSGTGLWARIDASGGRFEPDNSTSGASYDASVWKLQAGADILLAERPNGRLVGGIAAHYGTIASRIESAHGNGRIDTTGYGLDGTLTWYADNGFYADGQAHITWFDSDLASITANSGLANGNRGTGYALSVEVGQRMALGGRWSMTPQAQLSYSSVRFNDFVDPFGADVSLDRSQSLLGRLGITLDRQAEWQGAEGGMNRSHVYGIANLYYDFAVGSRVNVGGTPFVSENDALWGGIGVGGSLNWVDDKYSLYGEALARTSLESFGDSNIVSGTIGFRMRW